MQILFFSVFFFSILIFLKEKKFFLEKKLIMYLLKEYAISRNSVQFIAVQMSDRLCFIFTAIFKFFLELFDYSVLFHVTSFEIYR